MRKNLIIILIFMAFLSACGSTPKKNDVAVEDQGQSLGDKSKKPQVYKAEDGDRSGISALSYPYSKPETKIIYFEYDKSDITPKYYIVVEDHATYLIKNPGIVFTLEGHADERGSREYNLALSEKRAQTVKRQLTLLGTPSSQIYTISYGEEKPAIDDHDDDSWSQNRRVEIIY